MLIQKSRDPVEEKAFTEMVLADDAKNYHAWSHRCVVFTDFPQRSMSPRVSAMHQAMGCERVQLVGRRA
jgi:hypothetical protein